MEVNPGHKWSLMLIENKNLPTDNVTEVDGDRFEGLGDDEFSVDELAGHGLGQELVQEVLAPPLLLEVVLGPLLHHGLQVAGVALHAGQQVVQDVAAAQVLVDPPQLGAHRHELQPGGCRVLQF